MFRRIFLQPRRYRRLQLSFKGLPCPNLGTGGHGYHGPLEHVTIEGMEAAVRVIVELVKIFANE